MSKDRKQAYKALSTDSRLKLIDRLAEDKLTAEFWDEFERTGTKITIEEAEE